MTYVQTVVIEGKWDQRLVELDEQPAPLAQTPDGRLIVMHRQMRDTDFDENGWFRSDVPA